MATKRSWNRSLLRLIRRKHLPLRSVRSKAVRQRLGYASGRKHRHEYEHIPTGSIGLDLALGIGGLPRGRIIEIWPPESSGNHTVALHSVAEAQKLGGHGCVYRCRARARPGLRPGTRR